MMNAQRLTARSDGDAIRDALEQIAQYGVLGDGNPWLIDVGSDAFISCFEREILDDLVQHGGSTCRFFEGSYGAGKTHLLRLLGETARARGMVTARMDLTHEIGLDDWRLIAAYVLSNLEVTIGDVSARGLPDILSALAASGEANIEALRAAHLAHTGFQAAMIRAATATPSATRAMPPVLRSYLLGSRVSLSALKHGGVRGVKDPLVSKNAEQVLSTVLGGLFHLGLPGTLLLFDENESSLFSKRAIVPRKLQAAANIMRRLIDGCTTGELVGTVAVFAVLPGFLDTCAQQYPALGQRLEMPRRVSEPSWRWPIMPVTSATSLPEPEDFLEAMLGHFQQMLQDSGCDLARVERIVDQMSAEGETLLASQAGSGYRRPLMKHLATLALGVMEEAA